jgi:hypothetical protein
MNRLVFFFLGVYSLNVCIAQTPDTLRATDLSEVIVEGTRLTRQFALPDRHDGFCWRAKKAWPCR